MAEVVAPDHRARHAPGIGTESMVPGGPRIEMISNPDFSFPRIPQPQLPSTQGSVIDSSRRPASVQLSMPPPPLPHTSTGNPHRRSASTLPGFNFNSADTSGRKDNKTPPQTPDENEPVTPSRRGHRRGGSEFVGGDSRLGVSNAVSSSPTKANAPPLAVPPSGPPPSGKPRHAHRRSAAMSSHDVSVFMQPTEVPPRLSSSLPTTPLEHPIESQLTTLPPVTNESSDPFGPPIEDVVARPPSRPRVGFSDNVEFIPRPLSTISSETESSISTVRGHVANNSINSLLSMGSPSPPSSRTPRTSLSAATEETEKSRARSSLEISKRIEKEGEWLKSRSSGSLKRPYSEPSVTQAKTTFVAPDPPVRERQVHNKRHSLGHALGFDRRKSEPLIGMNANEASRLSAISLQDPPARPQSALAKHDSHDHEHFSSARKLKQWATAKISKKTKEGSRVLTSSSSASSIRPVSEGSVSVPGKVPMMEPAAAETDLDAVFSSSEAVDDSQRPDTSSQSFVEVNTPALSYHSSLQSQEPGESSPMLDLDAALGPFKTPPNGPHRQRKELHSSRLTKDFSGPGGHYHRRADSAPSLQPFESYDYDGGTPPQSPMADVFEEEEEEEEEDDMMPPIKAGSVRSGSEEDSLGIQIMDSSSDGHEASTEFRARDGLGIVRGEWEPERPTTSYSNLSSRFSAPGGQPRAASIAEETIIEETATPPEMIEIVEAHEEPRASSLTKSSDSSETPTILPPTSGTLTLPDGQQSLMTPDTYQTSAFSSPDFRQRQGSFDTSRLGTSASSVTDNRTMSSCATGDHSNELRMSVDDVPSLTSSRSTMLSTGHANNSRREVDSSRNTSGSSNPVEAAAAAERRRKRSSIQSLSQLVGGSFGSSKSKGSEETRPHTAAESVVTKVPKKKEHRLKKLMFWKSKQSSKISAQPA